jgi:hypothetical protein
MQNTYVIDVIRTFHDHELEEFRLFLDSPYFNRGFNAEKIKLLYSLMVTAKHKDTLEEFDKILVYKLIFPSMDFVEGKLDKLNSELKKLLQTFLTIQRYSAHDHEVQRMIDLTAELRLRGLEERYLQTLEKTKKQIEAQKEVSLGKFQGLLAISLEEHEWESTYNKAKGDLNIPAVIKHLDQYYYTERTGMLNLLLLQQKAAILQSFSVKLLSEHLDRSRKNNAGEHSPVFILEGQ